MAFQPDRKGIRGRFQDSAEEFFDDARQTVSENMKEVGQWGKGLYEWTTDSPNRAEYKWENFWFRKKFEDSPFFQDAYEAAQTRLVLKTNDGKIPRWLKGYYENAWKNMARHTLETAWIEHETPQDPPDETAPERDARRMAGKFNEEEKRKIALVDDVLAKLLGKYSDIEPFRKEERRFNKEVKLVLGLLDVVDQDEVLRGMKVDEITLSGLNRTVQIQRPLLEYQWDKELQEITDQRIGADPDLLAKLDSLERKILKTRAKFMSGERLLQTFLMAGDKTLGEWKKDMNKKIEGEKFQGDSAALKIYETSKYKNVVAGKLLVDNYRDFAGFLEGGINSRLRGAKPISAEQAKRLHKIARDKLGMLVASWDGIDQIAKARKKGSEPGVKVFADRSEMMSVDWRTEMLLESPLYQEMSLAVSRLLEQDLEQVSARAGARADSEQSILSNEAVDNDRYQAMVQESLDRRATAKKRYGKFFLLFDPDTFAAFYRPEYQTPKKLEAAKESSEVKKADGTAEELQSRIREQLKETATVSLGLVKVESPAGGYDAIVQIYSSAPWENEAAIKRGDHIAHIDKAWVAELMKDSVDPAIESTVKARLRAIFESQLSLAGLSFGGREILDEPEKQARVDKLYAEVRQGIIKRELYGQNVFEEAVEEKETLSQPEIDRYVERAARFSRGTKDFMATLRLDADGKIVGPTTSLDRIFPTVGLSAFDKKYKEGLIDLLYRTEPAVLSTVAWLKAMPGVKDAQVVLGAAVATFDSQGYIPQEFSEWLNENEDENDSRGRYRVASAGKAPIVLIDINPTKYEASRTVDHQNETFQHELSHHLIAVSDYLAYRDGRLGMKSAFRNKRDALWLGADVDPAQKRPELYREDAVDYSTILGREFDPKKDPQRLIAQQGFLEELSVSLGSLAPEEAIKWLYLDNDELYSARNANKRGRAIELVGNAEADQRAIVSLITIFQGWVVLGNTDPTRWVDAAGAPLAVQADLPAHRAEGERLWTEAVDLLGTARSVTQAERMIKGLWEASGFKAALDSDAAFKRRFDEEYSLIF